MGFFETAEFWVSCAFVLIVLLVTKPLGSALEKWGKKKADDIQSQIEAAQNLVHQAENLKQQYEASYKQRIGERQRLIREAENEIQFLETEALDQSSDRMRRKKQEVELRLKMIAEQGRQDIKKKVLEHVLQKTEKLLDEDQNNDSMNENTDMLADRICQTLDAFENVLK